MWLRNSLLSYEMYELYKIIIGVLNMQEKKKFDKEYSTQYTPEVKYLSSKGIKYTFVKDVNGVITYKYTKTPELFRALVIFYS